MSKIQGGGFFIVGAIMVTAGIVLRWDLIDWLIDTTGFVLIVLGAIIGIIGLIKMFTGGGQTSSDY